MNNFSIITETKNNHLSLVIKTLVVGIITSLVVVGYRFALAYAEKFSFRIYDYQMEHKYLIPIWFIALALMGYIVGKLIDKEPYIGGSGIPQVKAVMGGYIKNRPLSTIINKFIGGTLAILSGLSLGREGPSVQLGAATGDLLSKKFKSSRLERRLLISSGASAGLSAAFNAPLAGVMFSLEEIYKYFSPLVLLSTITASIVADFISKHFFGLSPIFNFNNISSLPLNHYWLLLIFGIIIGVLGAIYNWTILKSQALYGKLKCSNSIKMMIPFLLAGILGLIFPVILCGGHAVLEELTLSNTLGLLLLIVVAKFLFSMISFGSGAPGGIFFPLLIIGGGIGAISGYIAIKYFGVSPDYFNNFITLGMVGYFSAIVRAPITGIILITEMSGSFTHLLPLSIVAILAYLVADLLKSIPIYDSLMDNLLKKNNIDEYHSHSAKKIIISNVVHFGSEIENKRLHDIFLPENTLIVSLNRGDDSIVPKGNTLIKAGDELLTMTDLKSEWKTRELLEELTTK